MPPTRAARLRLVALSAAIASHVAAFAAFVTLTLKFLLEGHYSAYRPDLLAPWLGLSAAPALILSPLVGVLAGSRWSWGVLVGSAAVGLAAVGWAALTPSAPWLSVASVVTLEVAFFGAAALALLAPAAEAARLRLPTVLVGVALAGFAGAALGFRLGLEFPDGRDPGPAARSAVLLAAAALVATLAARISVTEPLSLSHGLMRPYLAGVRDAARQRRARGALIGLWLWGFVASAVAVVLWRLIPALPEETASSVHPDILFADRGFWFEAAVLGGATLAWLNRHPYRHGWLVPYAAVAGLACFVWWRLGGSWRGPLIGVGLALGASFTPLLNAYLTWTTPKHHGAAAGLLVAGWCAAPLVLAAVLPPAAENLAGAETFTVNVLIGVAAVAAAGAWPAFGRATLEGTVEPLLMTLYRIRLFGPDAERLAGRGPCLVIANHAAWFDPLWLGQALPAPIIPMMTSKFYDLPVISWLMRYVFGTIRVPEAPYRREAPELKEAVAALDRGECVVLFPEGYLRRKEEQPLRRFGRGVWQILADRPGTPVFACWIDGGWGSYFSYKGGPPTKNKRMDFWRPIRLGVVGPFTVDPAALGDHMATRTFLMHQVNAARAPLGLEPLSLAALPEGDKE